MMPPTSIDGTDITGATIDGQDVQEITVDGQTVFSAGPALPSGTILHVDANQESLSNNASVSQISDFSGSGNDLIANRGTANFETNVRNGRPAYDFSSTTAYYDNTMGLSKPWTAVMAVKPEDTQTFEILYSTQDGGTNRGQVNLNDGVYNVFEAAVGTFSSTVAGSTDWQIVTIRCIASGTIIRKNGSVIITMPANANPWNSSLRLGTEYGTNVDYTGYHAEIIHSTNDLGSTGELSTTESEMAARWNITI